MGSPIGTITVAGATYSFIWEGQIFPMQSIDDPWARLGQLGNGAQTLGAEAPPSPIKAFYLTNSISDALVTRAGVMQLRGLYAFITEPNGASWTGAYVRSVVGRIRGGIHNYNGISYSLSVEFDLVIIAQQ